MAIGVVVKIFPNSIEKVNTFKIIRKTIIFFYEEIVNLQRVDVNGMN